MTKIFLQKLDAPQGNVVVSYVLTKMDSLKIHYDMGITTNPLPENTDEQTILVKVTGNSTGMTLSWVISNSQIGNLASGSGVDSGTATVSIWDQLKFFDKILQSVHIGDTYRLVIADAFSSGTYTNEYFRKEGALTDMDFNLTSLEPVTIRATVDLQVGIVVGALDADTPSEPLNLAATNPSHGTVVLTWTTPTDAGGTAITGYVIQRRSQVSSYADEISTGVVNTATDVLVPVGTWYYQITAINTSGRGLFSDEVKITVT